MPSILHHRTAGLAVIHLNRPDKLNALSSEMFQRLSDHLAQLAGDDTLRVVILTGSGDRAFSAGTDIGEIANCSESEALEISRRGQLLCDRVEYFPVPVIAAINGIAAGGGCELALACHLRIASSSATFSLPEIKLGLIPGYGGTQRLAREVGLGRAVEIMLTGKTIKAEEALEMGMVNSVVSPSELMTTATSMANEIAQLAPLAIRACLSAVVTGYELPLKEGLALETQLFASLFTTDDVREGTRAFLEKRPPVFTGK